MYAIRSSMISCDSTLTESGEIRVYHSPAHACCGVGISYCPVGHVFSGVIVELVELPGQSSP